MLISRFNLTNKLPSLTISISLIFFTFPSLVKAQNNNFLFDYASTNAQQTQEKNSSRNGLPFNRIAGGSRGNCLASNHPLIALVPEKNLNLTTSTSPQLFFYIPATTNPHQIEFVLRNQNDELVYETSVETNHKSGIVSIKLPNSIESNGLKLNENYHWYLSMICDPQQRSHDLVVEGWIRRIELETAMQKQLQNYQPVEQAQLYYQNGIWYDALATIAQEQNTSKWSELLNSIGLADLAQQPIINRDRTPASTEQ